MINITNTHSTLKGSEFDPIGGLYIHLLRPNRDINEPGKNIKSGTSVIKPGKFVRKLSGRMVDYNSARYWKFDGTNESAFSDSLAASYVLIDFTVLEDKDRWIINALEAYLMQLVKDNFKIISKIGKGRSEYREIEFTNIEAYETTLNKIEAELRRKYKLILK
jgi:hypothetical protein